MTFDAPTTGPLWLASRSARRRLLLAEAGIAVRVRPAGIDDGCLPPGPVPPVQWVMALAYLKGRWVAETIWSDEPRACGTVLSADTVCVHRGRVLGQPRDADAARAMVRGFRRATHRVITGVCLISLRDRERWMMFDEAVVHVGDIADADIDRYVASGAWRGKAGAYNLSERQDAGWDVTCEGDPATVMGLPMRTLGPWLARLREERG